MALKRSSMRLWLSLILLLCSMIPKAGAMVFTTGPNDRAGHSLVLHGHIESLEIAEPPPSGVRIVVRLKLELVNDGSLPILLLKEGGPMLVEYSITRTSATETPDNRLASLFTGPGV